MKKQKTFLLLFNLVLGNFLIAQSIKFNEAFPIAPYSDSWSYSVQNSHGVYIIYGITVDSINHEDPAITKIDTMGNILWQKSYNRLGYDFLPFGGAYELGINVPWGGGVEEIDWVKDTSLLIGYWGLYRFDGNGDTVWTKMYQDTSDVFTDQIIITRDRKYLVYGAWINYSDHLHGFTTLFLRKMDSLGNIIWTKTYHSNNSRTREASGIDTCKDGGYILCAYDYDTITNYSKEACHTGQIMVIKTDTTGNPLWTKYIPNPLCDVRAFSIITLKNGGYAVCGFWDDSLNWDGVTTWSLMYLAKLNDTGAIVWSKTFGVHNFPEGVVTLYSLRELTNGDIVACGYGGNSRTEIPGVILRTDSNGNQKWFRYYTKFFPGEEDYLTDIQSTTDGGFISSGWTFSTPPYIWVVKVDSLGCDSNCNVTTGISNLISEKNLNQFNIFPNPARNEVTISYNLDQNIQEAQVVLYDVVGNKVATWNLPLNSNSVNENISSLSAGFYLYCILVDGKAMQRGKLVIEK